jgi:hypothetical protein
LRQIKNYVAKSFAALAPLIFFSIVQKFCQIQFAFFPFLLIELTSLNIPSSFDHTLVRLVWFNLVSFAIFSLSLCQRQLDFIPQIYLLRPQLSYCLWPGLLKSFSLATFSPSWCQR